MSTHCPPKPLSWLDKTEPASNSETSAPGSRETLLPVALARLAQTLAHLNREGAGNNNGSATESPALRHVPKILDQLNDLRKLCFLETLYKSSLRDQIPKLLNDLERPCLHPRPSMIEQIGRRRTLIRILSEPRLEALKTACATVNRQAQGASQ
jgi:hypothetical protein